jgi:Flp pilus assembly protein TadG
VYAKLRQFRDDEGGASFLEFTLISMFFFVLLFGAVEFFFIFYQWNVATKATQMGARVAAVSDPVARAIEPANWTGLVGTAKPGDPVPAAAQFNIVCEYTGASLGCSSGAVNAAAFTNIVQRMQAVYYRVLPQNVVVRYTYTGMGYAGRPGGAVPTVTVSLKDMRYDFIAINVLAGLGNNLPLPPLTTTISGEDLSSVGS